MLPNLLNVCVVGGAALPENPAILLGTLCPVSVTSALVASLWPQCFSTKVDPRKESVVVYCREVFWTRNVSVHSSAALTLTCDVTSSLPGGWARRSFSSWRRGNR